MQRINLMPSRQQAEKLKRREAYMPIILVLIVLGAILNHWQTTAISRYQSQINKEKEQQKSLKIKLEQATAVYENIQEEKKTIEGKKVKLMRKLSHLENARQSRVDWSKVLTELGELMPDEIWVKEMEFEKKEIKIGGSSPDATLITKFMDSMDQSRFFMKTGFSYIEKAAELEISEKKKIPVNNFEIVSHLTTANSQDKE